jgi:predicted nucleic acid-binding protein
MDAFDADALIYAGDPNNPLGVRVRRLVDSPAPTTCIGSVLLLIETLIKPVRQNDQAQLGDLRLLLSRLQLHDVTVPISDLAVELGARYRIKTVDAVHLATAVFAGADRFVTNNRRDFSQDIAEIDVTYPDELPAA